MSHTEHVEPIFRTSPQRTARMMAIMLGICIVGGIIFFGMWGYWISGVAPVASGRQAEIAAPVAVTGKEIPVTLKFIESSDFRTLAFNALPGESDNNPTINAAVGDKIIFNVENAGKSFHSFGVVAIPEEDKGSPFEHGPYQPVSGSEIGNPSKPLKPGESGKSEFIPGKEGIYYYICTVPGHREQGMQGKIIVGDVSDVAAQPKIVESEPSPSSAMPAPGSEVPEMIVEEESESMTSFSGTISVPHGSSVPGCDETNECFIPAEVTVNVGDTVTWSNDDSAAHTVTSGTPSDGPDGKFDSSLFMAGTTFSYTFDKAGEYNYFCMVHPWMTGKVQVN